MLSTMARHRKYDPCRTVHWRWELATTCWGPRPPRRWHDDSALMSAWRYQCRWRMGEEAAALLEPLVAEARALWLEDRPGAREIEARVLAGQSTETIAVLTAVDPDLVRIYEALFFDVRDRANAQDWIALVVLRSEWADAPSRRDQWRWIGRFMGAWTIDLLVSAERRHWVLPPEEIEILDKIDRVVPFVLAPFADRRPLFRYAAEYVDCIKARRSGSRRARSREMEKTLDRYHRGVAKWTVLESASGRPADPALIGPKGGRRRRVEAEVRETAGPLAMA